MAELNEIAEEISEQAVGVAKVVRSMNQVKIAFAGMGAAFGAATGAFIAYNIAYKRAETKFNEIAQNEISEMKAHYIAKTEATMGRITKPELNTIVTDLGYRSSEEEKEIASEEVLQLAAEMDNNSRDPVQSFRNVFEENTKERINELTPDVWDYAVEVRNRSSHTPYVIHADEHEQNEKDYDQTELTYYEGDDILANERDEIIEDQDMMVGLGNLTKFGHGSNDPNIVYIRNDQLELDIEMCRSSGSYAEEVHGISHSDEPRRSHRQDWDE